MTPDLPERHPDPPPGPSVPARESKAVAVLIAKRIYLANTLHRRPKRLSHRIHKTDARITTAVLQVLSGKPGIKNVSSFCQNLSRLHEEHRAVASVCSRCSEARAIEAQIIDLGESLGTRYGRSFDPANHDDRAEAASAVRETLIKRLYALLITEIKQSPVAHPGKLEQRLEERAQVLWEVGERRGQNLYIRANRAAYDLKLALRDPVGNRDVVYRMFAGKNERERDLLLEVFGERYGRDFDDVLEKAYKGLMPKVKNLLRLPALRASLEERYGVEVGFFKALRKELIPSGREVRAYTERVRGFINSLATKVATPEISRIQALLRDDTITAATDSVFLAVWYSDRQSLGKISAVLQDLDLAETRDMERDFFKRYGPLLKQSLKALIQDRFVGLKQRYLLARLVADDPRADAVLFKMRLEEGRHALVEFLIELSKTSASARATLCRKYQEEFGHGLSRELFPKKIEPEIVDWALHLLEGRRIQASASRLRCATRKLSGEWPGVVFYGTPTKEKQAIITSHDQQYGADFWTEFRRQRGKDREVIMRHYIEKGELGDAELIRHCLVGFGSDITGLKRCFEGRSKKEIAADAEEYANRFSRLPLDPEHPSTLLTLDYAKLLRDTGGALFASLERMKSRKFRSVLRTLPADWVSRVKRRRNLNEDLALELSGYKYHDIKLLRWGKPESPQEQIANFRKRYLLEHGGKEPRLGNPMFSRDSRKQTSPPEKLRSDRACHDNDTTALLSFYNSRVKRDQGDRLSCRDRNQFRVLLRIAQSDLDIHRDVQRRKVDTVSNLASALITAATGSSLAFLRIPIWYAMPIVGLASYQSRYLIRVWLQGRGYGADEETLDMYLGVADGCTLSLAKWFKVAKQLKFMRLARMPVSAGVKMAMKKTLSKHVHGKLATALLVERESGHARTFTETDEEEMRGLDSAESLELENHIGMDRNLLEKCLCTRTLCKRIGREYLKMKTG